MRIPGAGCDKYRIDLGRDFNYLTKYKLIQ